LAKLGFAKPICKNTLMMNHFLEFYCSTGEISHIESFGIIPRDSLLLESCVENEHTKVCDSLFDKN